MGENSTMVNPGYGRVAAVYDIHGNLPALDAALTDIEQARPDLILVGGDVVAGPMAGEALDRLLAYRERVRFIRGNADREVTEAADEVHEAADVWARRFAWAQSQLTDAHRQFLSELPETLELEIDGLGPTLFCHGSPRSDEEIITRVTSEARLDPMLSEISQEVIVSGHTHVQFDRIVAGKRLVNPGSVGLPYEDRPGAYWALLGPGVELLRTDYDVEEAAKQIRHTGFPEAGQFVRDFVLDRTSANEATAFFERMAEDRGSNA